MNQIAAREKKMKDVAALGLTMQASNKEIKEAKAAQRMAQQTAAKKRKRGDDTSDSDDSDSDASDADEPMSKAQKASAAVTPGAVAAAAAKPSAPAAAAPKPVKVKEEPMVKTEKAAAATEEEEKKPLIDTTGMTPKDAKAAIVEAKRAARALKKQKNREQAEAAGVHPTQRELQLMHRDVAAEKLWELYVTDREERGVPLTPLERDEHLVGKCLAQLPGHEKIESHSFKLLAKSLKSMYGGNYAQQVLGGTIQPALTTKMERFEKKKQLLRAKLQGDEDEQEEAEEEEEQQVQQIQKHLDDPTIGAPYVVFIAPTAVRAVEIGRGFKQIPMQTRIVKLFAKHLKIDQQREELSHDVRVAIGTPARLLKLSQNGFLKWNRAHLIVWDIGKSHKLQVAEAIETRRHKSKVKKGLAEPNAPIEVRPEVKGNDQKMFTLLSLKDTKSEVWKLYEQFLHQVVVKKQTAKIVLL